MGSDPDFLEATFDDRVAGDAVDECRHFTPAALVGMRAARVEGAALGRGERVRHLAAHGGARAAAHAQIRYRVQQHARVRMAGT